MKNKSIRLPDFIGIGVPKAGTTWFSRLISQHPLILFPSKKEIHFFSSDENYAKGAEYYSYFFESNNNYICGEFSTKYLKNYETVIPRIKETYTDPPKLVCILRDPVGRSISHYHWLIQLGILPRNCSLTNAIKMEPQIIEYSCYSKPVTAYIEAFGSDNVLIILMEEMIKYPNQITQQFFEFVGLNNEIEIDFSVSKGETFMPKFVFFERIRKFIYFQLYRYNLDSIITFSSRIGLSNLYRMLNREKTDVNKALIKETELITLNNCLSDEKLILSKLFPRVINYWKN